jgi:tRNA threonylcarbamoyl adenosine modification protein YeaZ
MILIINTSGTGIDLVMGEKFAHMDAEKQAIQLPTFVEKFITDNGVKFSDLTAIGIVVGPGSFTGIRIGIAYAKGLSIGLNIPVVPINAFEIYLAATPDAFVAIESGRGDFFVGAKNLPPCTMGIDELEKRQMAWPQTVGHKPFDLKLATKIVRKKLESGYEPAIPMYLRPSYAEEKNSGK